MSGAAYFDAKSQYDVLDRTREFIANRAVILRYAFGEDDASRALFIGGGGCYHIARGCERAWRMYASRPAASVTSAELAIGGDRYKPYCAGGLAFIISRDGSGDDAECARIAKDGGCKIISLICAENSSLGGLSDFELALPWAADGSGAMADCLYLAGIMLCAYFGQHEDILKKAEAAADMPLDIHKTYEKEMLRFARRRFGRIRILADGELSGAAGCGAMIFNETCRLPAEYSGLLDAGNGVAETIDNDTLVVVCTGGYPREREIIDALTAQRARLLLISGDAYDLPEDDLLITLPDGVSQLSKGMVLLAVCRMAAYYKSQVLGV